MGIFGGIDLLQTTTGELQKRFQEAGLTGGTVNMAISFFMAAAKEAEIELSSHVKVPRAVPKKTSRKRERGPVERSSDDEETEIPEGGGVQRFPIPVPQLGVEAAIILPRALDQTTWEMVKVIAEAYANALIQSNVSIEEGDDDE
jgi:hypothetical protein